MVAERELERFAGDLQILCKQVKLCFSLEAGFVHKAKHGCALQWRPAGYCTPWNPLSMVLRLEIPDACQPLWDSVNWRWVLQGDHDEKAAKVWDKAGAPWAPQSDLQKIVRVSNLRYLVYHCTPPLLGKACTLELTVAK